MAKDYPAEVVARRAFVITMVGTALYVASVFLFVL